MGDELWEELKSDELWEELKNREPVDIRWGIWIVSLIVKKGMESIIGNPINNFSYIPSETEQLEIKKYCFQENVNIPFVKAEIIKGVLYIICNIDWKNTKIPVKKTNNIVPDWIKKPIKIKQILPGSKMSSEEDSKRNVCFISKEVTIEWE